MAEPLKSVYVASRQRYEAVAQAPASAAEPVVVVAAAQSAVIPPSSAAAPALAAGDSSSPEHEASPGVAPASQVQTGAPRTGELEVLPRSELERRAGEGDMAALSRVALLCLDGSGGMQKDYGRARLYSERAWRAGDALGSAIYGALLRDGIAGAKDEQRGLELLRKSAEAGVAWAHYQLGVSYQDGLGVQADPGLALAQLQLAAAAVPDAQRRLAALQKR